MNVFSYNFYVEKIIFGDINIQKYRTKFMNISAVEYAVDLVPVSAKS